MAEEKSRFRRFVDYLNAPTQRQEQKISRYNQSTSLDRAVYGYNTDSGYFPASMLDDIGDGSNNSAVVACLNVLATSFAEPRPMIFQDGAEGDLEVIKNHPVAKLLERPNPFTSGNLLAHYIVTALSAHGDAFLYKNKNNDGTVIQLIPLMPDMVEPKGDEENLITEFKYSPYGGLGGNSISLKVEDIVHIRNGIDPNNHRRGFAPLKSWVMRPQDNMQQHSYITWLYQVSSSHQKMTQWVDLRKKKQRQSLQCINKNSVVIIVVRQ